MNYNHFYCAPECQVESLETEGLMCMSASNEGFTEGGTYSWE